MKGPISETNLEYYVGKLEPAYESLGEQKIGRTLDQYGIAFFYRHPTLIYENGRRELWYPDFTLPTFDDMVIEYPGRHHQNKVIIPPERKQEVYRQNDIPALFLKPADLARPDWVEKLYETLGNTYHRPLTDCLLYDR